MYCSNCGKERKDNASFCYNCGNKLDDNKKVTKEVKSGNQETSLVLGIICLVSSFIVNILCFIPGIISIIYAKKYKKESGKLGVGFGLSIGGMIYSLVTFILIILLIIFFWAMTYETNNEGDYKYNYDTQYTYNVPYI